MRGRAAQAVLWSCHRGRTHVLGGQAGSKTCIGVSQQYESCRMCGRRHTEAAAMTCRLYMGAKYGCMTCGHVLQFVGGGKLWLQNGASC